MLLVMFQILQATPGINPQVFLPRHGNEVTFYVFLLLKLRIMESPKLFKQILVDLFLVTNKKGLLNKSAKFH